MASRDTNAQQQNPVPSETSPLLSLPPQEPGDAQEGRTAAARRDDDDSSTTTTMSSTASALAFWRVGALYGATAVAMGAFGAHGLKRRVSDPQKLASWATAAHYQLVHSGAVMLAASVGAGNPVAAGLFTAGMTMFSGSIYALVLDPDRFRPLGPVTPLGGLCLIAGWVALGFGRRGALPRLP